MLSLALHLFVWLSTPYFIKAWKAPAAAKFEAVLLPKSDLPSVVVPVQKPSSSRTSRTTRPPPVRTRPVAVPEAHFVAPEGSIAIEPAPRPGDGNATAAPAGTDIQPSFAEPGYASAPVNPVTTSAIPPSTPIDTEIQPVEVPVQLPARIAIAYKMTSSISDGVAYYAWARDGDRFEIDSSMQATGFIIGNFVGVLHQVSRGLVTPAGLQPISFQIQRGEGALDTADFLHKSGELKLTRAGDARLLPLPPLIQDMQSFLFQLAFDAPKLQGPDDRLEVLVTNARKVYRHRFRQVGMETIEIRSGTLQAMHLRSEAVEPEDTYEVWLTPDNHYLPVRIRFYAGRFPVELIATSIRTTP
ncbi:MAG: DUF3108 domain-containing protein [Betaproteobacteria bacterium]